MSIVASFFNIKTSACIIKQYNLHIFFHKYKKIYYGDIHANMDLYF